jgi:hypothetical protein
MFFVPANRKSDLVDERRKSTSGLGVHGLFQHYMTCQRHLFLHFNASFLKMKERIFTTMNFPVH